MARALTAGGDGGKALAAAAPPGPSPAPPLDDSARGAIWAGWLIVLAFFGGFGSWAALAPLHGAVVAEAVVKVEGNRKAVQHLDGGIVREVRVKDGDRVAVGDVLVVLDDAQVRAEHDVLAQQQATLGAARARLQAELAGRDAVEFPPELLARQAEPPVRAALEAQRREFESRRAALLGEEQILTRRISQLREQIAGNDGQIRSFQAQLKSVVDERDSLADLLRQGLVPRIRVLQLDRAASGLEGQIAAAEASTASARQAIEETAHKIDQLRKDRAAEVTRGLSDTQARLNDVEPRLASARTSLGRLEVRSPYAGTVIDLSAFSLGGVIGRGQKILDVVPDRPAMVVEGKVAVEDISDLRPGMRAEVHFTSYKQRTIPLIHGTLIQVSADRLTDERSGVAYYLVQVEVDADELAAAPQIQLYPGMPATVMITTQERTALDYLIGPLVASFDRAFRQR